MNLAVQIYLLMVMWIIEATKPSDLQWLIYWLSMV